MRMNEETFLEVFEGVPVFDFSRELLAEGISITPLCAEKTKVFSSKGELRRLVQGGGFSINKVRTDNPDHRITYTDLLNDRYILLQKGRKNYFILRAV